MTKMYMLNRNDLNFIEVTKMFSQYSIQMGQILHSATQHKVL